ncbi:hypothetical protein [Zavarzinia sp. CC-PAN008]|uniref:hypothetical protein n=1 Tax=Zavarzinia sp. CC-PAN008 TaxID=3243332 RepID=UPI003F749D53
MSIRTLLAPLALAAALAVTLQAGPAAAWERNSTTTTPRGTWSSHGGGSCAHGTCSRHRSVTGPQGYSASRSGSVTRVAPGSYAYSRTTTGPRGHSVTRSGTVYRPHPYSQY